MHWTVGSLHMLHIGATSSKFSISIQHGRNLGPQLRPNLDPLGSNFGPTWLQHWAHLGGISAQVELHLGSTQGTLPARYEIFKTHVFTSIFHVFLGIDDASNEQCSPFYVSVRPNLVQSCRQDSSKLRHVGPDLGLHVHSMASTWGSGAALGPTSAQPDQLAPTWAQVA